MQEGSPDIPLDIGQGPMDGLKKLPIPSKKCKCLKRQPKIKGKPDFSQPQKKLKQASLVFLFFLLTNMQTCTHVHAHTQAHTHTHMHTHTCTDTRTHIHMYTITILHTMLRHAGISDLEATSSIVSLARSLQISVFCFAYPESNPQRPLTVSTHSVSTKETYTGRLTSQRNKNIKKMIE